ncbi:MAG: HepT-like ribonuclease domain-containing protein [Sulfuricaulis sp.]
MLAGEAVKRLTENFRNTHPEIPWKHVAGMRDVLIHQYDDVDLEEVWRTIQIEVPKLIALLKPLVPPRKP